MIGYCLNIRQAVGMIRNGLIPGLKREGDFTDDEKLDFEIIKLKYAKRGSGAMTPLTLKQDVITRM